MVLTYIYLQVKRFLKPSDLENLRALNPYNLDILWPPSSVENDNKFINIFYLNLSLLAFNSPYLKALWPETSPNWNNLEKTEINKKLCL